MGTISQTNSGFLAADGARAKSEADRNRIFARLKDAILSGSFGEAGRLPTERALAEQFGAARNTIRKTLALLADEGLIQRQVGRGTFVTEGVVARSQAPDQEFSLAELLEARLLFEPSIPELVVERATDDDIALMEAYLAELNAASTWFEFKEAKYCLHLAIVRAAHNRFISFIFEQIVASRRRAKWGRANGHINPVASVREVAYRDNARIVDALKAGDTDTAREAIRSYLLNTLSATSSS
ncbi:FadR/GntR family transcriptional regulator [Microbaculum marinisediminis]|uniref:GntR family transcriptional regulator n=1 Tax=Microbaculum marinisediminis TaxID=2931392 RepID=A0AAW5R4G0_9HYPH|nr:FCD domain-containing protein [Microbaculum sp. A6E488]MCT8974275.1 GntR family transcriptional regulator [Microbaculum sp. A6E488]